MKLPSILFLLATLSTSFAENLITSKFCHYDTIRTINDSTIIVEEDCLDFSEPNSCTTGANRYLIEENSRGFRKKELYPQYLGSPIEANQCNSGYYFLNNTLHILWIEPHLMLNTRGMESFSELTIPALRPLIKKRKFVFVNDNTLKDVTTTRIYNRTSK